MSVTGLASGVVEIVEPKDAGDHTCGVIDSKKVLVVLLDVENYCASHVNLGQQVLISKDEKDFARLLILVAELVMVLDRKVLFTEKFPILGS